MCRFLAGVLGFGVTVSAVFSQENLIVTNEPVSVTNEPTVAAPFQRIPWNRLPEPVQRAFQVHTGQSALAEVEDAIVDGRRLYRGIFNLNGRPVELLVTPEGSLYSPQRMIGWNEVPLAVQESFRTVAALTTIESITERRVAAGTVYEFLLNDSGQRSRLQFDHQGALVRQDRAPQPLVRGVEIPWTDLPLEVQATVRDRVGRAEVKRVVQGTWLGRPIYDVFTVTNGVRHDMRISPGGVVTGGVILNETIGERAAAGLGEVSYDDLPFFVQMGIRRVTVGAPIRSIGTDFIDGQTCYRVVYERDGEILTSWIDLTGRLVR